VVRPHLGQVARHFAVALGHGAGDGRGVTLPFSGPRSGAQLSSPAVCSTPPKHGVPVSLTALAILALFSSWWLRRFRWGPLEWVWRSLTCAGPQPIRRLEPA